MLKNEDMDILMQGLSQKLQDEETKSTQQSEEVLDRTKPYIYQQKGSVVYIRGLPEEDLGALSYMKPIKVTNEGDLALVIGLEKNQVVAILINQKRQDQVLAG